MEQPLPLKVHLNSQMQCPALRQRNLYPCKRFRRRNLRHKAKLYLRIHHQPSLMLQSPKSILGLLSCLNRLSSLQKKSSRAIPLLLRRKIIKGVSLFQRLLISPKRRLTLLKVSQPKCSLKILKKRPGLILMRSIQTLVRLNAKPSHRSTLLKLNH